MRAIVRTGIICALVITSIQVCAQKKQVPPLERLVSIKVKDEAIANLLAKISTQTGIKFSYNPRGIPVDKKVTFNFERRPVRTVLSSLFGETVRFRNKGNFLILRANTVPPTVQNQKAITVSGYVYNERGERLTSASILSKDERASAVSDQFGYYRMKVQPGHFPLKLKVEKENYRDTLLVLSQDETSKDLVIKQDSNRLTHEVKATNTYTLSASDSAYVKKPFWGALFLSKATKAHMLNLKDTLYSHIQFSFVPYISTNGLLVGNTINDYSFNLLAGYSKGVRVAEFGGLANIVRGDVKGIQAAGLVNAVSGTVKGTQLAGLTNLNAGRAEGFRAAGLLNAGHHMNGVQLAGIANVSANYVLALKNIRGIVEDTVIGFQGAGIININAGYAQGVRLAGLYNAGNNMDGVQVAGTVNANAGYFNGTQVAGTVNITIGDAKGLQLAGICNYSNKSVTGSQICGIVNIAENINGLQLGLINISDSCTGIAVGFLNISGNGYHRIELMGDEVMHTGIAFRTGVPKFHNIFLAAADPFGYKQLSWSLGYGIGTAISLNPNWRMNTDLIVQFIMQNDRIHEKYSPQLNSLFIGVERSLGKKASITLGPVVRLMLSYPVSKEYKAVANAYIPYSMYHTRFNNGADANMWVGGRVSLNLF